MLLLWNLLFADIILIDNIFWVIIKSTQDLDQISFGNLIHSGAV